MNMAYQPSKARTPVGACAVIERGDEVVMLQRTGAHGEGTWSFPGGWVEPGEDPRDAAIREVWEEVGLTLLDAWWMGYTVDVHPEGLCGITMWFGSDNWLDNAEPKNRNPARVVEVCWWSRKKLQQGEGPGALFLPLRNALRRGMLV